MDNIVVGFIIVHLLTTAFGLAVLESVKEVVEDKLHSEGYIRKNKNSLYNFNDSLVNVAKGFIPFYYFSKSLSLIGNKKAVDKRIKNEINSGNYIKREELNNNKPSDVVVIEDKPNDISLKTESDIVFEKPERYKARKQDYSIYNTYETPIEYITRESTNDNELDITPYNSSNEVIEEVKPKETINKSDIAKAISELSPEELDSLREKLTILTNIKREELKLKLEKDVA